MKEDMATRTATHDDVPRITELLTEMRDQPVDIGAVELQFEAWFDNKQRTVMLVHDDEGVVVGMAVVNQVYKLPKVECRLDEVIVSEAARGKGYGRELIEACEAWAWQHDADVFECTSRPSREAANALYQKLGFELRDTNVYIKKRSA